MTDIVKRLKAHKADIWNWNGAAMTAWDSWRTAIASGDKSSWPRDAFESLIGAYGEDMGEAADEIARLKAEVERKDAAINAMIDFHNGPLEAKRPDIFQRLMVRLAAALNPSQEPRT